MVEGKKRMGKKDLQRGKEENKGRQAIWRTGLLKEGTEAVGTEILQGIYAEAMYYGQDDVENDREHFKKLDLPSSYSSYLHTDPHAKNR